MHMCVIIRRAFVSHFCSSSLCVLSLTEIVILVLPVVLCSVTDVHVLNIC